LSSNPKCGVGHEASSPFRIVFGKGVQQAEIPFGDELVQSDGGVPPLPTRDRDHVLQIGADQQLARAGIAISMPAHG
jgi:hypothetical protein